MFFTDAFLICCLHHLGLCILGKVNCCVVTTTIPAFHTHIWRSLLVVAMLSAEARRQRMLRTWLTCLAIIAASQWLQATPVTLYIAASAFRMCMTTSCRITKVRQFQRLARMAEADGHLQQRIKQLLKLSKEKWDAACGHAKTAVQV